MREKTKWLCIKDLTIDGGSIAFKTGEVYTSYSDAIEGEIKGVSYSLDNDVEKINEYFSELKKPKEIKTKCVSLNDLGREMHTDAEKKLTEIFNYVLGGYIKEGEYSDLKIRKGRNYGMEEIVEKFFKIELEEAKAFKTALEISRKFEINQDVLEQLKTLEK